MPKFYTELEEQKFHISIAFTRNVAMHGHEFLEFSYVKSGTMLHEIDGMSPVVQKGEYFIVDYGTCHAYKAIGEEPLEVINLLFYPEFLERTLAGHRNFEDVVNSYLLRFSYKTLRTSPTGKSFQDEDGKISALVTELIAEYEKKSYGHLAYIRSLFLQILILTMRKIGKNENAAPRSDSISAICAYLETHFAEKIKLTDLAKVHHYSLSHLSRKFTEETGLGFTQYLQKIRIEQSCRLLENGNYKISEIAALVGYEDIQFFNRIFKETLNVTPREFKARYKE